MRDPESGNSKGYAFVNFASFEASDMALEAMNGQYLCNRAITCSYAFKKDAKGERHGTAAERLLAAQNPLFTQDRPHQMFADMPGGMRGPTAAQAVAAATGLPVINANNPGITQMPHPGMLLTGMGGMPGMGMGIPNMPPPPPQFMAGMIPGMMPQHGIFMGGRPIPPPPPPPQPPAGMGIPRPPIPQMGGKHEYSIPMYSNNLLIAMFRWSTRYALGYSTPSASNLINWTTYSCPSTTPTSFCHASTTSSHGLTLIICYLFNTFTLVSEPLFNKPQLIYSLICSDCCIKHYYQLKCAFDL